MNTITGGVKNRKIGALARLEAQLKLGVRTPKGVATVGLKYVSWEDNKPIPLTEEDTKRINSEISILKEKIKKLN